MALVWRVWGDTKGSIFIRSLVTFVWSSGDAEKAMAPHSSTLAWKIPWLEEPGRLQSKGSLRLDTTEQLHFHFSLSCIGAGNGNPLQCCCLENSRDGGAWWAAAYGVAQSRTRLKRLSSSSSSVHQSNFRFPYSCFRRKNHGNAWKKLKLRDPSPKI